MYGATLEGAWPSSNSTCFTLHMGMHCLHAEGTLHSCEPQAGATFEGVQRIKMARKVGSQCKPQSARRCSLGAAVGVQTCNFGYWSTTCSATEASDTLTPEGASDHERGICPFDRPFWCKGGCHKHEEACYDMGGEQELQRYAVKETGWCSGYTERIRII